MLATQIPNTIYPQFETGEVHPWTKQQKLPPMRACPTQTEFDRSLCELHKDHKQVQIQRAAKELSRANL